MIAAAGDHFVLNHDHLLVPLAPGPCELLGWLWVVTRSNSEVIYLFFQKHGTPEDLGQLGSIAPDLPGWSTFRHD